MTYYKEAFRVLLDRFAQEVKQGKYKKLDYNLWRDLYGLARLPDGIDAQVDKCYMGGIDLDILPIHSDTIRHYNFETEDGSFGEFLTNELACANLSDMANYSYEKGWVPTGLASVDLSAVQANRSTIGNSSWNNKATLTLNENDITFTTPTISCSMNEMATSLQAVSNSVDTLVKEMNKIKDKEIFEERKENGKMFGLNFDFGSCEHDNVKMSMYGLAVKNASGEWVSYDRATGNIINVDILNFDGGKYLYKMPVALKDVQAGDVILHARKPMFVSEVVDGKIIAADPFAGEEKIVLPTKNCFGFDFATKIVNMFEGMTGGASAAAPFGNMLPLLMMGDGKDVDPMVMMMAMGGQMDMSNPMMMYALMSKDGKTNDLLPFLMMGMGGCNCGCHKED